MCAICGLIVDICVLFHCLLTCRFLSTDLCVGKNRRKSNITAQLFHN